MEERGAGARHEGREDLAGEHPVGDTGQVILVLVFVGVWAIDTFWLGFSTGLNGSVPLYARIPTAAVLLALSGYLARSGLRIVFGEVREEPRVIREGVFGLVRHPIYLSAILFYAGLLAASVSIAAAVVWIVAIVFYIFISRHEEKLLTAKFGSAYEEYMRQVPMLMPTTPWRVLGNTQPGVASENRQSRFSIGGRSRGPHNR